MLLTLFLLVGAAQAQIGSPDLYVARIQGPRILNTKTVTYKVTVANKGKVTSKACHVSLQLVNFAGAFPIGTKKIGSLLKLVGVTTVEFKYTPGPHLASGPNTILATADSRGAVNEYNERNNTLGASIVYVGSGSLPDLRFVATYPTKPKPMAINPLVTQAPIFIWSTVINSGTYPSSPTSVAVFLSKDRIVDKLDLPIGLMSVVPLPPLASTQTPTFQWKIPTTIQPGNYYLLYQLDPTHHVLEITKGNNLASVPVTLYERGSFEVYKQGCKGTNGTVSHVADTLSLSGDPFPGATAAYKIVSGPPSSAAILMLGLTDQTWGAFKLPLDLTGLGAPGCSLLTAPVLQLAAPTSSTGSASIRIPFPANRSLAGARLYTQYLGWDPKANSLGLSFSNGIKTTIGTVR